eukprot:8429563-Pyramimonas_sp.AAC.1
MARQHLAREVGDTRQAFLHRGIQADDSEPSGVSHHANEIKSLGLRNCGVKIISALFNKNVVPVVASVVP